MMRKVLLVLFAALCLSSAFAGEKPRTARPLHYLSTDKQLYHPGDTVYVRDVQLDGQTNFPLVEFAAESETRWKLYSPRKEVVASGQVDYEASVGAVVWRVPAETPGGVYTIRVEGDGAPAERSFEVRNYRVPRIRTQVDFLKRGYLPGEELTAVLTFRGADGEILANPRVSAVALLDDEIIFRQEEIAVSGESASVTFAIPSEIARGDGILNFTVRDGGIVESTGKTIPILLERYTVEFYPEGGELAEGIPNRVYVEAVQENGIGADIDGCLRDASGKECGKFATIFDGRGILSFTPEKAAEYHLEIRNRLTGQVRNFPLPKPKACAVLSTTQNAYAFTEPIRLRYGVSPESALRTAYLTLRKRDAELCRVALEAPQGEAVLDAQEMEGVLIATLYAKDGTPLAERLLFRYPKYRLHTVVKGLEKEYLPGQKVSLSLETTDDAGMPVSASLGVTVTDASVVEMTDRRDVAPRLPAMVYLENEVRSFADAGDYFDPRDSLAPVKIDLLLGTQGWRRFVPLRKEKLREEFADALLRILAPEVTLRPPLRYKAFGNRMRMMEDRAVVADNMAVEAIPLMAMGAAAIPEDAAEDGVALPPPAPMPAPAGALPGIADFNIAMMEAPARAKMARRRPLEEGQEILWIREYAHKVRENRKAGERSDFTETVFWCANRQTDPRTGIVKIEFELPDTIGAFRIAADSFGNNGALGEFTCELKVVQPFSVEVKSPLFLTVGDQAYLPVTLINATAEPLDGTALSVETGDALRLLEMPACGQKKLMPGEKRACRIKVEALSPGKAMVRCRATAGGNADSVTREITVLSPQFPFVAAGGARIRKDVPCVLAVEIPQEVERGSQKVTAQVYTSPAATMEAALNALLRQPHGCFEQTSSTNYPLVMAQQYFLSHAGISPEAVAKAQTLLEEGYKKLISFQCTEKGYEWFGENPGHEALSAYGLMEFADMAKVMPVDRTMVEETRQWLLKRRDGMGGFLRNDRALDSFGRAPENTTNAYILWALLESGESPRNLKTEIQKIRERAETEKDDYLKALAANILWLAGEKDSAARFASLLAAHLNPDGTLSEAGPTITCSGTESRNLECTALAALAWIRCGGTFIPQVECAMEMLAGACKAGKFGSTQSTVLVLKAINAYDASFAKPKAPGTVQLWLDGKPFGQELQFDQNTTGILTLTDCGLALGPGKHILEIRLTGESELTASLKVEGKSTLLQNAGVLELETALETEAVREGDPMQLQVKVTNRSPEEAQMPIAIVAIPGGAEAQHDQLKELVKSKRIAAYEILDNQVVLYWRGLPPGGTAQVPLALTAVTPGSYTAAASRTYLYYDDAKIFYRPGTKLIIR